MPHDSPLDRLAAADADAATRRTAARELFEVTRQPPADHDLDADDLSALADALDDPDELVRGHAAAALGDLAFAVTDYREPLPHLPALLDLLTGEPDPVRQTVLGAFENRGDRALWRDPAARSDGERVRKLAAVGLVDCFDGDADVVRRRAGGHLSASLLTDHPDLGDRAVPLLVERLDDPVQRVREAAGDVLAEVAAEHPDVVDRHADDLTDRLDADAPTVRLSAARALAALADDRPGLLDRVAGVLVPMLDADEGQEREAAATAVGNLADRHPAVADRVVEPLVDQLASPDRDARGEAASQLARLAADRPDAVPEPVLALAAARAEGVELDAFGTCPLPRFAPAHPEFAADRLAALAGNMSAPADPSPLPVREFREAADVDPAVVEPALPALCDALDADGRHARDRAALTLGDLAEHHPDLVAPVADRLVGGLGDVGGYAAQRGATGALYVAVDDPDAVVAAAATLLDPLAHHRTGARHAAAGLLASLGHDRPGSVPPEARTLAAYLESEHPGHLGHAERLRGQYDSNVDYGGPYLEDDPRWPLGVLVGEHPRRVAEALRNVERFVPSARAEDEYDVHHCGEALAEVASVRPELARAGLEALVDLAGDVHSANRARHAATQAMATVAEVAPDLVDQYFDDDLVEGMNGWIAVDRAVAKARGKEPEVTRNSGPPEDDETSLWDYLPF